MPGTMADYNRLTGSDAARGVWQVGGVYMRRRVIRYVIDRSFVAIIYMWNQEFISPAKYTYICDCVCINQPFSTKVEFSAGAKVVNTLPFYAYISKSENPNNFTVESLNKKLTSAYSVYKSLFNGVLISEFIKCAICLVYANMVTYISADYQNLN